MFYHKHAKYVEPSKVPTFTIILSPFPFFHGEDVTAFDYAKRSRLVDKIPEVRPRVDQRFVTSQRSLYLSPRLKKKKKKRKAELRITQAIN